MTFGRLRHTQRQRARHGKLDIDSFANVQSMAWIIAELWIIVVIVLVSIFVGRLLTTSECDLHEDYRMRGINSNSLTSQLAYHD